MGNKNIEKSIPTTSITPPPPKNVEKLSIPTTNVTPPPTKGNGKK